MPEENNSQNRKSSLYKIRTLKSDYSEILHEKKISLTDIFLRQPAGRENIGSGYEKNRGKKIIAALTIVLILLILGTWLSIKIFSKKPAAENEITAPPQPIMASQKEIIIDAADKKDFDRQLKIILSGYYRMGDFISVPVKQNNRLITSKEFLNLLQSEAPVFLTIFLKDNFFLGILSLEKNNPLLIFEIEDGKYDTVFSAMLKWEKYLTQGLSFIADKDIEILSTDLKFKDEIVQNQSVRTLETTEGETIFLYTIFNKKYLIITNQPRTFEETIKQLVLYRNY